MAPAEKDRAPEGGTIHIDPEKLRQAVDDLLQKDQLDNDKGQAGNKPGGAAQPPMPDEDTAAELNRDHHD